ncbi:MAG: hypothetical protein ACLRSD_00565 [Oscillibacter sp.]
MSLPKRATSWKSHRSQQRAAEDAVLKLQGDKNHYDLLLSSLRERLERFGYRARDHRAPRITKLNARWRRKRKRSVLSQEEGSGRGCAHRRRKSARRPERAAAFDLAPRRQDRREKERARRLYRRARDDGKSRSRELGRGLRAQMHGATSRADARSSSSTGRASEQSQREIGTHETEIAALSGKMTEKRAELEALSKAKLALEAERSQSDRRGRELNENVLNVEAQRQQAEQSARRARWRSSRSSTSCGKTTSCRTPPRRSSASSSRVSPRRGRRIGELKRAISGLGAIKRRRDRGIRAREYALHLPYDPARRCGKGKG